MAGEPLRKSRRMVWVLVPAGCVLCATAYTVGYRSLPLALVLYIAGAACGLLAALRPVHPSRKEPTES
jgi:hypothetical protein